MTRDSVFQGTGIDDGDKYIEICWECVLTNHILGLHVTP